MHEETSLSVDISSKSLHLTAIKLTNPVLYAYFPSFQYKIARKILNLFMPGSFTV